MFATRKLQRRCLSSVPPFLQSVIFRESSVMELNKHAPEKSVVSERQPSACFDYCSSFTQQFDYSSSSSNVWSRGFSTSRSISRGKGSSMRSKVEKRMRKESGRTLREIRRARKLKKKLMTDEERLLYNLRRAKKKVTILLQRLKKYELPELPPPVHDPELLTPEQFQAFKKIGFRNKNYVPVGVRGVFGGVVQNMHMHWKFHETVQVCCDNFPKEKIKDMAISLARLSGGIVVNIHNVKTIIMFRGRNYRQPKNLIPFNTLTKRKALFKARFEQALESQKLNIKKLEQDLRRMGINPEDPIAMASIQRVASTFFSAIDQREGSPYVFQGDKQLMENQRDTLGDTEPQADSDQEELDRFIADIEDAADKEWEAEEEAEKEEYGRIRYWNRETYGERRYRSNASDDDDGRERRYDRYRRSDSEEVADQPEGRHRLPKRSSREHGSDARRRTEGKRLTRMDRESSDSENLMSDVDNAMWESESDKETPLSNLQAQRSLHFRSSDSDDDVYDGRKMAGSKSTKRGATKKAPNVDSGSENDFSDPDFPSGSEEEFDYRDTAEYNDDYNLNPMEDHDMNHRRASKVPINEDRSRDS